MNLLADEIDSLPGACLLQDLLRNRLNAKRCIGVTKALAVTTLPWLLAWPALAQNSALATKTGSEVGLTVAAYKYTEPDLMSLKATKVKFDYAGNYAMGSDWPNQNKGWFLRWEAQFSTGKADYSSSVSGTQNNLPDWYYEIRGLIGKDFDLGSHVLSPYVGLGYRYLYNDLRGTTTTGSRGYRREVRYTTLPIGVTHKTNLASNRQLLTTVEYTHLIRGNADAKLSDSNVTTPDVSLKQTSGYGFRVGTMVRFDAWSVGPSLILWRIKDSETVNSFREPRNNTYEFGVKAAYHF